MLKKVLQKLEDLTFHWLCQEFSSSSRPGRISSIKVNMMNRSFILPFPSTSQPCSARDCREPLPPFLTSLQKPCEQLCCYVNAPPSFSLPPPPPPPPATHCQCPHLTAVAGPLLGFLSVPPGLRFASVFPRFKRSVAPPPPLLPSDTEKKHRVPSYELHIWPVICICSRLPKRGHRVCCDTLPPQTEGAAQET